MSAPRQSGRPWLMACALLLFIGFVSLGSWQVQRRAWKLDLIERVTQRVAAPAVAAPGPAQWPSLNTANDEYRHVRLTGRFIPGRDTQVQAVTRLGSGYWLLSPLQLSDGAVVLVNRGFIAPQSSPAMPPGGEVTVAGLLRLTEPGGGFLRHNDPAGNRWFSRDVQAIAQARGLAAVGPVAPYFVDADADLGAGSGAGSNTGSAPAGADASASQPVGGLTVIAFANSHLVYALTWFALALMSAGAGIVLARQNRQHHDPNRRAPDPD